MGLKEAVKISGLNVPAKISGRGVQVSSTDCKADPPRCEIPINLMITNMKHNRYIMNFDDNIQISTFYDRIII